MPSILNLKFKGNKSFVAFSNLNDTESLTKTWKVCTKVASYLEQGQRLENLSWRLWHLQNLMVDTDNARSKREFKKLSKCMGDKLDKEKGRSIEELEAPDYKRTSSSDMIRQRAVEKERYREQNAKPGTIKRMQFTFSIDQPLAPGANFPVKKPDLKPSPEFTKRSRATVRAQADDPSASTSTAQAAPTSSSPILHHDDMLVEDGAQTSPISSTSTTPQSRPLQVSSSSQSLKFDSIFNQGFCPSALLFPAPTLTTSMNYGEGLNSSHASNDTFTITRPTIELPLDDILNNVDSPMASSSLDLNETDTQYAQPQPQQFIPPPPQPQQMQPPPQPIPQPQPQPQQDIIMRSTVPATSTVTATKRRTRKSSVATRDDGDSDDEFDFTASSSANKPVSPLSLAVKDTALPETVAPSKLNPLFTTTAVTRTNLSTRPTLTVKTQTTSRSSGPGATATSLNPTTLRSGNSAPGGVKAECSNCGATHTPLWRRGLNDELNCNACGLYCKLHKRPRPKSMRNNHGEGRAQATPRQTHHDPVDVMAQTAQCYNCHTTATPLWRKDDEGKTVCNACGLYYKLHGSARPISMKSDVIRKRSRHDARRGSNAGATNVEDTSSASPGVSRRASPARDPSPTLAPDSTTALSYDYPQDHLADAFGTQSELVGALGGADQSAVNLFQNTFQFQFPGPYHPDYLLQMYTAHAQAAAAVSTGTDGLTGFGSPSVGVVDITSSSSSGNVGASSSPSSGNTTGSDMDLPLLSPRSTKRRRMSTDSASEPPSSAVSSFSFSDTYSPSSSTTSLSSASTRSSIDFPFTSYTTATGPGSHGSSGLSAGGGGAAGPALRGSGNTFWHPPMMPQNDEHTNSPHLGFHPPLLPPVSSSSSPVGGSKGLSSLSSSHDQSSVSSSSGAGTGESSKHHHHHGGETEDSPMDYLHPPTMSLAGVVGSDDESLFSAYLHPPMALQEDSPSGSAIVV